MTSARARRQTNFTARDFGRGDSAPRPRRVSPTAPPPVDENAVPTGTIPEIMSWVNRNSERAQRALDVEQENENPRATLITQLNTILTAAATTG